MSETILYGYWRSSATYRVRIALNLKGVAYRTVGVDLLARQQLEAPHLARHPTGRVPLLEIDGEMIGQSMAIVEYLDETRRDPPLMPADHKTRARVRDLKDQIICDIHPIDNTSVLDRLRTQFKADEDKVGAWYRHWIERGFAALEKMLPGHGDVCVGRQVTLADIVLVPQVANARRGNVDLTPYPNIVRIDAALRALPAFRDAAPENQPEAAAAKK